YPMWEITSNKDEEHPYEPYHLTQKKTLVKYPDEQVLSFEGRLIGGCMDCLGKLIGTRFDCTKSFIDNYQTDGFIWFLEACDLNVMDLRRTLWQMDQAGWFSHVKGFLIGRPLHYNEPMFGLDQYEAVMGVLRKYRVPVIMDADLGHLPPMMPLICGAKAHVTADDNIRIKYEFS
ncbi:MAG: LD-carboxypeptidase, partial [Clostridia bacterium]|nr:LD-carboxypeptidase [Clostridia bacterium]